MQKVFKSLLIAAIVAAPVAAGTKLTTTWKDPRVSKVNFNKIVVAFMSSDADLRRRVEGGLARRISRSVPSNTIIVDEDLKDREAVKAKLQSNGVDGALVVRLVNVKDETYSTAGESWVVGAPGFWDTWDQGWLSVHTASYVYKEKIVTADIILYSVTTAKPVWMGRLKSTDPKHLKELLDELVKEGASELKKQKLI